MSEKKVKQQVVAGPNPYPAGGFEVTLSDFATLDGPPSVDIDDDTFRADGLVLGLEVTCPAGPLAGDPNQINIKVYQLDTTIATPAWSELPTGNGGTDISGLDFIITAEGW